MQKGKIIQVNHEFIPLYRKGDRFKIIRINEDENLMPIEAISLRTREIYGFGENDFLEEIHEPKIS